jgi:hypothetical protein
VFIKDISLLMSKAGLLIFKNRQSIWWENLRERNHLKDPGLDRRIILGWIFRNWDVGAWTGSVWLRIRTSAEHL